MLLGHSTDRILADDGCAVILALWRSSCPSTAVISYQKKGSQNELSRRDSTNIVHSNFIPEHYESSIEDSLKGKEHEN